MPPCRDPMNIIIQGLQHVGIWPFHYNHITGNYLHNCIKNYLSPIVKSNQFNHTWTGKYFLLSDKIGYSINHEQSRIPNYNYFWQTGKHEILSVKSWSLHFNKNLRENDRGKNCLLYSLLDQDQIHVKISCMYNKLNNLQVTEHSLMP